MSVVALRDRGELSFTGPQEFNAPAHVAAGFLKPQVVVGGWDSNPRPAGYESGIGFPCTSTGVYLRRSGAYIDGCGPLWARMDCNSDRNSGKQISRLPGRTVDAGASGF